LNKYDRLRQVWGLLSPDHVEELEATVRDGSADMGERLEAVLVLIHNVRENAANLKYDQEG
jgi:hypothetical protein